MACSFTLKRMFCLIASVSKLEKEYFHKYCSDFLPSLYEFAASKYSRSKVFPMNLLLVAVTDGNPMQCTGC